VLFCVLPVCYDVRLSHLNKDYLLTYLNVISDSELDVSDYLEQEAQLMLTNPLDAFRGQSRSPNMVTIR